MSSGTVQLLNVSVDQVESDLLAGKTAAEVAREWSEPVGNVAAIFHRMKADGRFEKNDAPAAPAPAPRPSEIDLRRPVHAPSAEVKQRIASATELLVRADSIEDKRIQSALARARKAMTDLAGLVTKYEQTAEARARISELEAELAAEKAKLRPAATPKAATDGTPPRRSTRRPCAPGRSSTASTAQPVASSLALCSRRTGRRLSHDCA